MGWVVFFGFLWVISLILVPLRHWKRLWPAGLIGMLLVYAIDTTLIGLGAFTYSLGNTFLSGLPTFYWIGIFPGSILLAYYYPSSRWRQFPYILLTSAIFLVMEITMHWFGYFQYRHWTPLKSYLLNIGGFMITLIVAQWVGSVGKGERRKMFREIREMD